MQAPIVLAPLLGIQREIYDLPPGRGRFEHYLKVMLDPSGELALPLPAFNPMGKGHVAATLDALLALDAERVAARAIAEAAPRLEPSGARFRLGLVVVDDRGGGWTNRFTVEVENRRRPQALLKRGWAAALLWTSESPTAVSVRLEALATAYRAAFAHRHGPPSGLREILRREGLAAAFAGVAGPTLDADDLAYPREVIRPHLDADDLPAIVACLHGDAAARSVGFTPLGLSPRAGYELALADALAGAGSPEDALASG